MPGKKEKIFAYAAYRTPNIVLLGSGSVLTPEEEIRIIQKLVKQRRESAQIYRENNS